MPLKVSGTWHMRHTSLRMCSPTWKDPPHPTPSLYGHITLQEEAHPMHLLLQSHTPHPKRQKGPQSESRNSRIFLATRVVARSPIPAAQSGTPRDDLANPNMPHLPVLCPHSRPRDRWDHKLCPWCSERCPPQTSGSPRLPCILNLLWDFPSPPVPHNTKPPQHLPGSAVFLEADQCTKSQFDEWQIHWKSIPKIDCSGISFNILLNLNHCQNSFSNSSKGLLVLILCFKQLKIKISLVHIWRDSFSHFRGLCVFLNVVWVGFILTRIFTILTPIPTMAC